MKPGILPDVPEVEYHADPAFSQSQAKTLLTCPALYHWQLTHPAPRKREFDFGHAAHKKVLGVGLDVEVVPADLLSSDGGVRSNPAKAWVAERETAGILVVKPDVIETVDAMAAAIESHDAARRILACEGEAEQSMWWTDERTGVECRGRVDFLAATAGGLINVDYKTTTDASPKGFAKSAGNFGYHVQAAAYGDGLRHLTGEDVPTILIAQEKTPPYLVAVYQVSAYDVSTGLTRWREALDTLVDCRARDEWPAYSPDITTLYLPSWA